MARGDGEGDQGATVRPLPWREKLVAALAHLDPDDESQGAERLIRASAIIQEAFDAADLELTVVGGSAVTVWRPDDWASGDIDLVGPALAAQLKGVLEDQFGFVRSGRHWIDEELKVYVERPASSLRPSGATIVPVERFGVRVLVISIEDLIIDRVHAWDGDGSAEMWKQAADLLLYSGTDLAKVEQRAADESVTEGLRCVRWLADEGAAGRLGEHDARDLYDGYRRTRRFDDGLASVVAVRKAATVEDE